MKQLKDYVRIYDDAIDTSLAKLLINVFENNPDSHQRFENDRRPQFTQMNLTQLYTQNKGQYEQLHNDLQSTFLKFITTYRTETNTTWQFQDKVALEEFRIKRYDPWIKREEPCATCGPESPDQFKEHVDVQDYNSARRYLAFFLYLNEPQGGETVFTRWHQHIKPKCGRLLMFPPTWQYPHEGRPCRVKSKYILGSYLHYL